MTQQRVCVINVGSRGEKRGVLQLEREREKSYLEGKKGNGNRGLPPSNTFSLGHVEGERSRKPFLITTRYLLPRERARDFHT